MKNKRLRLMVIAIAAVILAVGGWVCYLWTTPARTVVDQTCSGMLLFADGREPVPCEVRLTGNYFHYRLGNEGDSFDGGYDGGVIADGVPLLDYLYAYFKTDYAFINGQQQQDVAISKDLDLIAAEVNYDTEQEMVVPFGSGEDCLLVAPASSREEAEALLTRLRDYCQSIDKEIDWCDPYLRIDGSPASGEQSADIDGAYYIEEFFADGIAVRAAESSQRQRLYFREDFWEDGELFLAAYGLEPLIDMPVQCTYEELQEQWTSDQVYHVFGPDGVQADRGKRRARRWTHFLSGASVDCQHAGGYTLLCMHSHGGVPGGYGGGAGAGEWNGCAPFIGGRCGCVRGSV